MTSNHQPGDIHQWDFQNDMFRGSYRLIEEIEPNVWEVERLAPTDAETDAILELAANHEAKGFSWMSDIDQLMQEIDNRIADAGSRTQIRMISRAQFSSEF